MYMRMHMNISTIVEGSVRIGSCWRLGNMQYAAAAAFVAAAAAFAAAAAAAVSAAVHYRLHVLVYDCVVSRG